MSFRFAFLLVLIASPALASQPGQPLGPEDWVFSNAALQAFGFSESDSPYSRGPDSGPVYDNQSRLLGLRQVPLRQDPCGGATDFQLVRTELVAWAGSGNPSVLGYVDDRCSSRANSADRYYPNSGDPNAYGLVFDPVGGVVTWIAISFCERDCDRPYSVGHWDAVRGFTTLLDIFDSFAPGSGAIGFRQPVRPEGLRAADQFDTYWGSVTRPLDLSQAHPLQCAYPDHQPQVGEYLTFPDAAPTPAPGRAVYYLTSVTYQGQTRAGRQATDGRLSGRDATRLPACVAQE